MLSFASAHPQLITFQPFLKTCVSYHAEHDEEHSRNAYVIWIDFHGTVCRTQGESKSLVVSVTEKIGTGHKTNLYVVLPFVMPSPVPGLRAAKYCSVFSLVFSSELFPLVFTCFLCSVLIPFIYR